MPGAEVRVLGPVEVVGGDGVVSLAAKQARLLAALLIAEGRACGSDELVEAVWHGLRPASARNLLQVYVSQLRKELPAEVAILTRPGGYALELDPRLLDAARFERLFAEGTRARQEGNSALALSLMGRALALWRGPAYGELRYDEFARGEAERLEELRMLAVEERLDAGLALGRHAELSPELQRLVGEHPLRERLQAQAMLALYRCGRQQEALDLYSATRARLVDELGLEPGGELRELQQRILQQEPSLDVAPAKEAPAVQLPAAPNPLLGRERELAQLRERLLRDDVRLLVLTGAGGSGKTRLALEAAHETAASYANGAAFVELAPLRDPALVLSAIVRALAIEEDNRDEPLEHLAAFLRARELLLVLDNAEHLHEATTVLSELLARAPRLTLLVTSRTVLHLSGEHVYPVQPLEEEAALALFHARARQADARFDADAADQEAMRRICLRLDGLPLAIELAAARTTSLRPSELLERLDPSLPLLTGGPRDLPARQRTLHATLEWSFGLLSEDEHALAARLGIFVGSFDLDAATTVCDADPALLTSLIEQSLLQRTGGRFQYLETIREYALEQLLESPGANDVRRRHFRYFRELAEAADLSAVRRGGGERLDLAAAARDNLRAALAWSLETASVALGLELATALERFWVTHDPGEGMRWFAALLDHPESANVAPAVRAHALRAYGGTHDISGDHEAAERLWLQSLELFEEIGDEHGRAVLLHRLGIGAMRRRDLARARELVTESHRTHESTGDRWGQAQTTGTLGAIERDSGNEARAYELIAASLTMAREAGVRWWESGLLAELAMLDLKAGRIDEAETQAGQCLMLAEEIGDRAGRVLGVGLCAALAALRGQLGRAEDLWASVAHEDGGAPLGGWRRHREDLEATIRGQLGAAWREHDPASALPLDDAVALALQRRA